MITIGAMLGIGFYVRIGTVLRTAGPLALILSFVLLAFLSWGVMQCITEMLSIWPVPGALMEFVGCFVDKELGYVIGIAYWSVPKQLASSQHICITQLIDRCQPPGSPMPSTLQLS